MAKFILQRIGIMVLTAVCLTFIVFFLTNLSPNLEKLAKTQGNFRMSDAEVETYLYNNGYLQPMFVKYGQWLGVLPGYVIEGTDGTVRSKCDVETGEPDPDPAFCGVFQGDWGTSTVIKGDVLTIIKEKLALSATLMVWVMLVMVPLSLSLGVLAGMREGSRTDRTLSTFSIVTTATPEYVSGILFIAIFASSAVGLQWFKGSATSAMEAVTFQNFFLPVITVAAYGSGYIARMTRASMAEVMTSQYIRTARLKGVSTTNIVLKHAFRNAMIAPFTVIMLQFPWLLNGVVIVETLFNYKGLGWALVLSAANNDVELLLGISVVSVVVVLVTQLISDVGYAYLNPRIRVQ
ncbi:MAG: ABC transporter permease [Pseudomonadota bacterium]